MTVADECLLAGDRYVVENSNMGKRCEKAVGKSVFRDSGCRKLMARVYIPSMHLGESRYKWICKMLSAVFECRDLCTC